MNKFRLFLISLIFVLFPSFLLLAAEEKSLDQNDDVYNQAYSSGYDNGYDKGYKEGYIKGNSIKLDEFNSSFSQAQENKYKLGYDEGFEKGKEQALKEEKQKIEEEATKQGYNLGYSKGYDNGYEKGIKQGYKRFLEEYGSAEKTEVKETSESKENSKPDSELLKTETKEKEESLKKEEKQDSKENNSSEGLDTNTSHKEISNDYNLSYEYPANFVLDYNNLKNSYFTFGMNFRYNINSDFLMSYFYINDSRVYIKDYLNGFYSYGRTSFSGTIGFDINNFVVDFEVGGTLDRRYLPIGLSLGYNHKLRNSQSSTVYSDNDIITSFYYDDDPYCSFNFLVSSLNYIPLKDFDSTRYNTMLLFDLGFQVTFPRAGNLTVFINFSQGWSHVFTGENYRKDFYNSGINTGIKFKV